MCLAGASGAGAELLAALPHSELRAHYVWLPMLPPDDEQAAAGAAQRFAEGRTLHYWDAGRHLSRYVAERLQLGIPFAWDVYLAFGPGAADVGRPAFWMHQLGVTHAPRLDSAEFRRGVEALLT